MPAPDSPEASFQIREARRIVHPCFEHRPWIYWADMLASVTIGYGFATAYLDATPFSLWQIACLTIAIFALFRVGSFIHEITHMRSGEMLGFRVAWNVICGMPMLMPSFFYENHIDHHKSHRYGTIHDGEYLPLGSSPFSHIVMFLLQIPLLPGYVFLRCLLSPITFLHPKLRQWTLEHASSFVINYRHKLTIPKNAPRRAWAAMELGCFSRALGVFLIVPLGFYDWTRWVELYVLSMFVLGLNYNRNLVAHHYRNRGGEMTHSEQLLDSVNIRGNWLTTELFFPLGLRYHALHHLFPSIPYHNLGWAHSRLMQYLPEGSLYRETVYPSYWSVLGELLADARTAGAQRRAAAA